MKLLLLALLCITLKSYPQCKLTLKNSSDSTITIKLLRLGIVHTLAPREVFECPKVDTIRKGEPYVLTYNGYSTASMGVDSAAYFPIGEYIMAFSYSYKKGGWGSYLIRKTE